MLWWNIVFTTFKGNFWNKTYRNIFNWQKYSITFCLVFVETIPKGAEPPCFTKQLQNTTIVEGSSVKLECKVKGHPHPEIEWYKDRKLVRSGRHYAISKEGATCVLTIQEAFPEDTGKYMCRAVNTISSATTEAHLKVQSKYCEEVSVHSDQVFWKIGYSSLNYHVAFHNSLTKWISGVPQGVNEDN